MGAIEQGSDVFAATGQLGKALDAVQRSEQFSWSDKLRIANFLKDVWNDLVKDPESAASCPVPSDISDAWPDVIGIIAEFLNGG